MIVLEVKNCIEYFESVLFFNRYLLSPDIQVILESTVGYLKKLQRIKREEVKDEKTKDL